MVQPQSCLLCGAASRKHLLCSGCLADLPQIPAEICPVCALPSPGNRPCGHCLAAPPSFDAATVALHYGFPADGLIHALKYASRLEIAGLLADLIALRLKTSPLPDCIVPMPMHPARLKERGFNQASEIARHLARRLGLPVNPVLLQRIRNTPPQTGLPHAQRHKNLRGAMTATGDLTGMHIALVDDVMTTGASMEAASNALKRAGAAHVECWVAARTLKE